MLQLMPADVGEVLGDASLTEPFLPGSLAALPLFNRFNSGGDVDSIEEEGGVYGYKRRVLHAQQIESFTSLSPPPSHLLLRCRLDSLINIDITHEKLQHCLSCSPHLSSLTFVLHSDKEPRFPSLLCKLLRNLPPSCPLRSLAVSCFRTGIEDQREAAEFADAFCESPARKLDCLCLDISSTKLNFQQFASKLQVKCRSLFLRFSRCSCTAAEYANTLLAFMPSTADCRLQELGLFIEDSHRRNLLTADPALHCALKRIESCKLKRLDMRGMPPLGPEGMSLLVASLASPACSIQDLGISLASIPHLHHTRLLTLAQAFQCGLSLSKLKVLRFDRIDTDEAAACVVDILGSPESNCKVRFLDIHLSEYKQHNYEPFFKKLCQFVARPPRIECLRFSFFGSDHRQLNSELACLPDFLGQEHCSLLWLEFQYPQIDPEFPESLQMDVANSLEANTLLTHLTIPDFTSLAARSRAATFLARNRLYKAMGLSKDDCMKPQMARLFLCGHGEVGKTTLRKALLKIHRKHPASSSSSTDHLSQANHQYGFSFNMCSDQPCRRHTSDQERTRGLEIHQLHFDSTQGIAIFDLGGQPDYHVFHHFLLTNTSQDLFIVVCKYTPHSTQASQLVSDLEYWLRFIVSHRNSVRGPNPKIMLVVNFFKNPTARSSDLAVGYDEFMKQTAFSLTQGLREKYAEQLDFGTPAHHQVFGIVANDARQARPILEMLRMLLVDLLNQRPMIPKLCDELMSTTLPLLARKTSTEQQHACGFGRRLRYGAARAGKRAFRRVIVDYEEVKETCVQAHQDEGCDDSKFERRIQGALTELHNVGELIFFPPVAVPKQAKTTIVDEGEDGCTDPMMQVRGQPPAVDSGQTPSNRDQGKMSPIIVDPNWFCNKVVGSLLAPQWLSKRGGSGFEWAYQDIRQFLIESGCLEQYVDEVLRYMLSLDLCYSLADKYFFPAVATKKKLQWPPDFISHITDRDSFHFYGRRIKCKDSEMHLIPSGVFARLQVKLQSFYEQGYKLGYHWASFVKDRVSVMVRFGRFAIVDDGESMPEQSHKLPISMLEDDHPEWIDILLCCPSSQDSQFQGTSVEYTVMQHIKKLIFDICQATSRGIPTVVLEECALRHAAAEIVMQFNMIEEFIKGDKGLASYVVWQDQHSTCVVDLLLPEELKHHVARHMRAIQQIQEEFSSGMILHTDGEGGSTSHEAINKDGEGDPQLQGEFKVLQESINRGFAMLGAQVNNVLAEVKDIKRDVRKLMQGLQQAEVNIVAQCSTRLLQQLLVQGAHPAYPYFTDSEGKMQRLKNFLQGKKAIVHFLCESHVEGPHIVEGQLGREVTVEKGILMKWAPFLIPSLMVICCAARFAANAFLPGVAPLIFDPFMHFLNSIGINKEDLQSQIIPKALNAIFDELDFKIQGLYDEKRPFININREQQKEGLEALQGVLGSIEGLDMNKDFGLHLVKVGPHKAQWLCSDHAKGHEKLIHAKNPFCKIVK